MMEEPKPAQDEQFSFHTMCLIKCQSQNQHKIHQVWLPSSTFTTVLFDAPDIPQINSLSASLKKSGSPAIITGSIYQLLRTAREKNGTMKKPVTYHCNGHVKSIQTKDGWFYFSCGLGGCKRRVSRSGTKFMCQTFSKVCEFPRTSYRLH